MTWSARRDPWPLLLSCTAVSLAALQPVSNPDTFGHLAQGRVIAAAGWPPALDPFSFWRPTPQPWVNYEWLSDWLTWDAWAALGPNGLVVPTVLIIAVSTGLAVALAGRIGGREAAWIAALAVTLTIPASRGRMSARPHVVALLLGAVYLVMLTRPRAARDGLRAAAPTLGALAVLHVLWVNLHGSHLLGAGIVVAAAIAGWRARQERAARVAALAVVAIASCISPWGASIVVDAVLHVFDGRYRAAITEWHSVMGDPSPLVPVIVVATLAVAVLAAWSALRADASRALLAIVGVALGVMTVRSGRFTLEMLTLASPLVGVELASRPRIASATRTLAARIAGAAVVASLAVWGSLTTSSDLPVAGGLDLRGRPEDASLYLAETLPGARVLGSMPTSWYLMFRDPSVRVLVDGRLPFYGPDHAGMATDALGVSGALWPVVRRFGVDTVVVQHTAPPEVSATLELSSSPRFVRAWIDASYAVYVRRGTPLEARVDPARFDALPGTYDPVAVMRTADAALPALREDVGHLATTPAGAAFAAFVRATLRARTLARDGGWAGLRPPATDAERAAIALARRELALTLHETGPIPVLLAEDGLLALADCDLDHADRALAAARADRESRETLFGAAELALRRGDVGAVRAFLASAARMPGAEGDTWIAALQRELDGGLRCP